MYRTFLAFIAFIVFGLGSYLISKAVNLQGYYWLVPIGVVTAVTTFVSLLLYRDYRAFFPKNPPYRARDEEALYLRDAIKRHYARTFKDRYDSLSRNYNQNVTYKPINIYFIRIDETHLNAMRHQDLTVTVSLSAAPEWLDALLWSFASAVDYTAAERDPQCVRGLYSFIMQPNVLAYLKTGLPTETVIDFRYPPEWFIQLRKSLEKGGYFRG